MQMHAMSSARSLAGEGMRRRENLEPGRPVSDPKQAPKRGFDRLHVVQLHYQ
jgi:hypothetical protein